MIAGSIDAKSKQIVVKQRTLPALAQHVVRLKKIAADVVL
jgi:hypothetical protein